MKKFLLGLGLGALSTGVATIILSQKECGCKDCSCLLDKEFEERKEGEGSKASDLTDKEFYESLYKTEPDEGPFIYLYEI